MRKKNLFPLGADPMINWEKGVLECWEKTRLGWHPLPTKGIEKRGDCKGAMVCNVTIRIRRPCYWQRAPFLIYFVTEILTQSCMTDLSRGRYWNLLADCHSCSLWSSWVGRNKMAIGKFLRAKGWHIFNTKKKTLNCNNTAFLHKVWHIFHRWAPKCVSKPKCHHHTGVNMQARVENPSPWYCFLLCCCLLLKSFSLILGLQLWVLFLKKILNPCFRSSWFLGLYRELFFLVKNLCIFLYLTGNSNLAKGAHQKHACWKCGN